MSLAMFLAFGAVRALGVMSRYGFAKLFGGGLFGIPMATLVVNVAGNSLMDAIAGGIAAGISLPEASRGFIVVGSLGTLRTFSSFAFDAGQLAVRQDIAMTALYLGLSIGMWHTAFFATQALVTGLLGGMSG